jgi:hypothetical protein
MGVEGRDLVDLDQGQPHVLGERREVARVQAAVMVLDQVQELDQEVGPARPVAEERPDLVEGRLVGLAPARGVAGFPAAGARMDAAVGTPLVAGGAWIVDVHDILVRRRETRPP